MNTKAYLIVSTLIFTVVAVMHLLRLVLGWSVVLGMTSIPLWASLLAVLVSASIAIWGMSLASKT